MAAEEGGLAPILAVQAVAEEAALALEIVSLELLEAVVEADLRARVEQRRLRSQPDRQQWFQTSLRSS